MRTRPYAMIHYHEIGLKGRNRSTFENILVRNLSHALTGTGANKPRKLPGRVLVELPEDADDALVTDRLTRVFGVANVGLGVGGRLDLDAICDVAFEVVRDREWATFAVRARKAHSEFPLSAREIN